MYILNDELRKSIDLDGERGTCSCKNNQITREVRSDSSPIKDRSQHNGSENWRCHGLGAVMLVKIALICFYINCNEQKIGSFF
jgi:hypothetical protein